MLSPERQSARMSKITTRAGTLEWVRKLPDLTQTDDNVSRRNNSHHEIVTGSNINPAKLGENTKE